MIITRNIEDWYNAFCSGKVKEHESLAQAAARLSYKASVRRALKYKDDQERTWGEFNRINAAHFLAGFLEDANFSPERCEYIIRRIKMEFGNIEDYTYGNAQKWVNIAIKYFIILNQFIPEKRVIDVDHAISTYRFFPVDAIMIKHAKSDFGIPFEARSWSNCDDLDCFRAYWDQVEAAAQSRFNHSAFTWETLSYRAREEQYENIK